MTTVVNKFNDEYDIDITRGTPWGNPFVIDKDGTRAEVIAKFSEAVKTSRDPQFVWIRKNIGRLKGKRLGCVCSPLACHGAVLAMRADETGD